MLFKLLCLVDKQMSQENWGLNDTASNSDLSFHPGSDSFDNSIKIYTYGSPRCGGKNFINSISNIPHKRFVNNNDIVTCVPSRIRIKHHGVRQYITSNGKVARLSNWSRFIVKVSGFFRDLIKGSIDWFSDHSIEEYSSKLKNVWKSDTKFIED